MPDDIVIQSHKGPYRVRFAEDLLAEITPLLVGQPHFLVDANVADLYAHALGPILDRDTTQVIEATEENKSIENVVPVIARLVANQARRDHVLVAIGGGVIQDITCFIASTLLRGMPWRFVPTTLLAQADSCIGSKSSINLASAKNILGTFNPPSEIFLCTSFLDTLNERDLRSGLGEVLKVHAIAGSDAFDRLAADFDLLLKNRAVLLRYIQAALQIKQRYIEPDEFDRGPRLVFNYGHSFGHAIEAATDFSIPHGIAVTIGMDMANHIAVQRGLTPISTYRRMHPFLQRNYEHEAAIPIPLDRLLSALLKDKKNTSAGLVLVMPHGPEARIERTSVAPDNVFREQCISFLSELCNE